MKTAYATIKGIIEVMRELRKGQASSFYYGQSQGLGATLAYINGGDPLAGGSACVITTVMNIQS